MTKSIKSDLDKAIKILKEEGCDEVYLYGSIAEDRYNEDSDIDLAVKGIPSGEFFRVLGRLMLELDHPVDLVDLDKDKDFSRFLEEEELVEVDLDEGCKEDLEKKFDEIVKPIRKKVEEMDLKREDIEKMIKESREEVWIDGILEERKILNLEKYLYIINHLNCIH